MTSVERCERPVGEPRTPVALERAPVDAPVSQVDAAVSPVDIAVALVADSVDSVARLESVPFGKIRCPLLETPVCRDMMAFISRTCGAPVPATNYTVWHI